MKILRKIYHFLGGIVFAIFLLSSAAFCVLLGTFLEAWSGSHRYAASFTYENPLFLLLIWGFFINILVSALRRWPFKSKHLPFLITHCGLLMILSGIIVKHQYGKQGSMELMAGTGSQEIFLSETFSLAVESPTSQVVMPLEKISKITETFPTLHFKLIKQAPHCTERLESWFKGRRGYIAGIKPFEVFPLEDLAKGESLPISTQYKGLHVMAFQTDQVEAVAKKAFLQGLKIRVGDDYEGLLNTEEFLEKGFSWELHFNYKPETGFQNPHLTLSWIREAREEKILISLDGDEALSTRHLSFPFLGDLPVEVDLSREPLLLFIEDQAHEIYFFSFGACGEVYADFSQPHTFTAYAEGYRGYTTQRLFPVSRSCRKEKEKVALEELENLLEESEKFSPRLVPPLRLLKEACQREGQNFPFICATYFAKWNKRGSWLYSPPAHPDNIAGNIREIPCLDWQRLSEKEVKACYWMSRLLPEVERRVGQGEDVMHLLQEKGWPFVSQMQESRQKTGPSSPAEMEELFAHFSQQLYQLADQLPTPPYSEKDYPPEMFSAYLRLYEIHPKNIFSKKRERETYETLETPLSLHHQEEIPLAKLEENVPLIMLDIRDENSHETKTLAYDRFGKGLKWPVLAGQYLLRFQPQFHPIPYRVRLRDARQINYANSSQPLSFESDLLITDTRSGKSEETTLSMNHIHETWDGYRFYLATLSPSDEHTVQRVHLIINHDPGKYFLTYPGALILALGMVLLFWLYPKQR